MIKKYHDEAIDTIKDDLKVTVEAHTRKQVQMHCVARNITQRFAVRVPPEFGQSFSYGKVFYSLLENVPVTVEKYIPGEFVKYINNDGECMSGSNGNEDDELFLKAECLSHFSYEYTKGNLMILDIQGSGYSLYDPEISTTKQGEEEGLSVSGETYFCAGNLSCLGIDEFKKQHKCSKFCKIMGLGVLAIE